MKTIVLSANPTPNMNLAKINIDNAGFDPHCGPSFWVTFIIQLVILSIELLIT